MNLSRSQVSVNTSLNNVRAAKAAAAARRRDATARLKAEREQEKQDNLSFNESKRQLRMDLLKARGDASLELAKHRARRAKESADRRFKETVNEGEFKSRRER